MRAAFVRYTTHALGSNMVAGIALSQCGSVCGGERVLEPVAGACVSVSSTADSFLFPVGMTPKLHVHSSRLLMGTARSPSRPATIKRSRLRAPPAQKAARRLSVCVMTRSQLHGARRRVLYTKILCPTQRV